LIAGLLIVSLTGQAAAAFRMACEGTAACCCRNTAAMVGMAADMAPMGGDCCATPESQPCDLAGPLSSPAAPFLPTEINSERDIVPSLAGAVATSGPFIDGSASQAVPVPPSLAEPPIYLQTQTFLY
jgi:hypothetical protein